MLSMSQSFDVSDLQLADIEIFITSSNLNFQINCSQYPLPSPVVIFSFIQFQSEFSNQLLSISAPLQYDPLLEWLRGSNQHPSILLLPWKYKYLYSFYLKQSSISPVGRTCNERKIMMLASSGNEQIFSIWRVLKMCKFH